MNNTSRYMTMNRNSPTTLIIISLPKLIFNRFTSIEPKAMPNRMMASTNANDSRNGPNISSDILTMNSWNTADAILTSIKAMMCLRGSWLLLSSDGGTAAMFLAVKYEQPGS